MKKITYIISIIIVSLFLFSCKSTKEVVDENATTTENKEEVILDNKDTKDFPAEDKKTEPNLIGWVDTGKKNPSFQDGIVKITTNSKLGTFCIYAVDKKGKDIPVLSTLNESSSTSLSLKVGKKVYRLTANKKVKTKCSEIEDGIRLTYEIKDTALVIFDMVVFPAVDEYTLDSIKCTITVRNLGEKTQSFALKTILDTVLGENGSYHFYNYKGNPVKSEVFFERLRDDKWFLSKNERASMQLMFDGGDTSYVEFLALANYKTLEQSSWIPSIQSYGTFDTVLSYNNSAVCVVWPKRSLKHDEEYTKTFYLSLALDGLVPDGYKYVYGIEDPEDKKREEGFIYPEDEEGPKEPVKEIIIMKPLPKKSEKAPSGEVFNEGNGEVTSSMKESEEPVTVIIDQSVTKNKEESSSNSKEVGNKNDNLPSVEFNINNISKEHLTQEYIQSLIKRIEELEATGSGVKREEILQLSAELDAIMSILR